MEGSSGRDIIGGLPPAPHCREDLRNAPLQLGCCGPSGNPSFGIGRPGTPPPAERAAAPLPPAGLWPGARGQAGPGREHGEPAGRAGPGRAGAARRCAERRRRGAQGEGRARRPSGGGGARAGAGAAAAAADSGPSKQARLPRPGGPCSPPCLRARPLLGPRPEPAPRAGAAAAAAAEALSFPARRRSSSAAETDPGSGARAEAAAAATAAAAAWGFVHGGPGPCARAPTRKSFRSPSSLGASGPESCSIWPSLAWPHAPTHPPQGSTHRARAWDQSRSDQAQALNI